MKIDLRYIDDDKILVREIRGQVTFNDIFKSWNTLIEDGWVNSSVIGVINDFRDMKLKARITDVNVVLKLINNNIDTFDGIKIAVVVDSYKNIVFPMMIEKLSKKVKIKPFSTFEAAREWVLGVIG